MLSVSWKSFANVRPFRTLKVPHTKARHTLKLRLFRNDSILLLRISIPRDIRIYPARRDAEGHWAEVPFNVGHVVQIGIRATSGIHGGFVTATGRDSDGKVPRPTSRWPPPSRPPSYRNWWRRANSKAGSRPARKSAEEHETAKSGSSEGGSAFFINWKYFVE